MTENQYQRANRMATDHDSDSIWVYCSNSLSGIRMFQRENSQAGL